jgi:pimeloyl-ACP methyl ester carboxylesterase
MTQHLNDLPLPPGIRSRFVNNGNALTMHVLEAGHETPDRPCVLLLHGFPELAYSWRKVMLPLAAAGYHVLAPDQRGYGRTTGSIEGYSDDEHLDEFRILNLVEDALGLLSATGHKSVEAVIGHDFGSPVAAWCALTRPDVFRAVVLMSAPFGGVPPTPAGATTLSGSNQAKAEAPSGIAKVLQDLSQLEPPRKHYQWYYSSREANADMMNAKQGLHAFLRAYYHVKSADWPKNKPYPLTSFTAAELAKLPTYYVMRQDQTMPETVAGEMPDAEQIALCKWLPDEELSIYVQEFSRTGFQGALQWYRCATTPRFLTELQAWAGRTIDVPACFISGSSDWGLYQKPGDFEAMQKGACANLSAVHLIEGAGHWVQQEQPDAVVHHVLAFLRKLSA